MFLRRMERDHPAGMVDVPSPIAAAGRNGRAERIPQGAAFQRRIDVGMRNGAAKISGKNRSIGSGTRRIHQRYSINQRITHPSQTAPMTASVASKTSAVSCGTDTRRIRYARGGLPWRRQTTGAIWRTF